MNLFKKDTLQISVNRKENKVYVEISSDYINSNRKSQLYVSGDRLGEQLLNEWKRCKTSKLKRMMVSFYPIDHYDDMTDIYETPIVSMERGLRKYKLEHSEHGSIPKEWGVEVIMKFEDIQTKKPIKDCITNVLGSLFDTELQKKFDKVCNPVIVGKETRGYISTEQN